MTDVLPAPLHLRVRLERAPVSSVVWPAPLRTERRDACGICRAPFDDRGTACAGCGRLVAV